MSVIYHAIENYAIIMNHSVFFMIFEISNLNDIQSIASSSKLCHIHDLHLFFSQFF